MDNLLGRRIANEDPGIGFIAPELVSLREGDDERGESE